MAKKRLSKSSRSKRFERTVSFKKAVLNPFEKFRDVSSTIKNIPLSEKTLLIALLIFMSVVAFTTNSEKLNAITGAAIGAQDLNEKISLVISLITDGFAKPVFDLLSPTPNVFFIKLALVIVFYLLLSYGAGLRNRFEGKGSIIAGIFAFLGVALLPRSVIDLYIVQFIPGFISVAGAILILFLGLYWLHNREVESRAGHGLKAVGYFIAFVVISELENVIAQAIPAGPFTSIVSWITLIAFVFALVMLVVELVHALGGLLQRTWSAAGRRDERVRTEEGERGRENAENRLRPLARNVLDELEDLV